MNDAEDLAEKPRLHLHGDDEPIEFAPAGQRYVTTWLDEMYDETMHAMDYRFDGHSHDHEYEDHRIDGVHEYESPFHSGKDDAQHPSDNDFTFTAPENKEVLHERALRYREKELYG